MNFWIINFYDLIWSRDFEAAPAPRKIEWKNNDLKLSDNVMMCTRPWWHHLTIFAHASCMHVCRPQFPSFFFFFSRSLPVKRPEKIKSLFRKKYSKIVKFMRCTHLFYISGAIFVNSLSPDYKKQYAISILH